MIATPEWVGAQETADWLTAAEQSVWQSFAAEPRRRDWLAGRLAAKRLLQAHWDLPPLAWEVGTDGVAPVVRLLPPPDAGVGGINISLSHSAGLGAAAWAETAREGWVGIDAQRIRPVHPRLAARILAPAEQEHWAEIGRTMPVEDALLLFWALKEAAIKARRAPWRRTLSDLQVRLGLPGTGMAVIDIKGEETIAATFTWHGDWWLARALCVRRGRDGALAAPEHGHADQGQDAPVNQDESSV